MLMAAAAGFIGCERWFRHLPMGNMDICQSVQTRREKYYKNKIVAMGHSSSSSTAQRVAFIILDVCEAELDAQLKGYLRSHEGEGSMRKLRDWIGHREWSYPNRPSQWRPWHLSSSQYDTSAVVLGPMAKWLDSVINCVLEGLCVPLSGKDNPPA